MTSPLFLSLLLLLILLLLLLLFPLLTSGPAKPDPPNGGSKKNYALKNRDFLNISHKKKIFCTLSSTFTQNIGLIGLFEFMLEMLK